MKKLLLSVALVAASLTASAADKVWNFSLSPFAVVDHSTDGTAPYFIEGLEICKNYKITASAKTNPDDATAYTNRLQIGGFTTAPVPPAIPGTNYVAFGVAGPSTITIYYLNSNSTGTRPINVVGADGNVVLTAEGTVGSGNPGKIELSYLGAAQKLTLYTTSSSGLNFYDIRVTNYTPLSSSSAISSDLLNQVGDALVNPTNLEVKIVSALGATVSKSSESSISISDLASGVYVAVTEKGTLTFIK